MSLKPCSIDNKNTLRDAALSLNKSGHRIVVITKENSFLGIVTDGDLRRGLLNGLSLDSLVDTITNTKCITTSVEITIQEAKNIMIKNQIDHLPLINKKGVCEIIYTKG